MYIYIYTYIYMCVCASVCVCPSVHLSVSVCLSFFCAEYDAAGRIRCVDQSRRCIVDRFKVNLPDAILKGPGERERVGNGGRIKHRKKSVFARRNLDE